MSRQMLIILVAALVIIVGVLAMVPDRDQPNTEGDHPSPATHDPANPAAPAR